MSSQSPNAAKILLPVDHPDMVKLRNRRMLKDRIAKYCMSVGGVGVVVAIMLIFFYLLYEVYPLLDEAELTKTAEYSVDGASRDESLGYLIDEQAELVLRYGSSGTVQIFRSEDGAIVDEIPLPVPEGRAITSFTTSGVENAIAAVGLDDGSVLLFKPKFTTTFPNDVRKITASIEFPLGEGALFLSGERAPLKKLAIQHNEDGTTLAGWYGDDIVSILQFEIEESLLDDEPTLIRTEASLSHNLASVDYLLLDAQQRTLYLASRDGTLDEYSTVDLGEVELKKRTQLTDLNNNLTTLSFLNGYLSLLVGESDGTISQWFHASDGEGPKQLRKIRQFKSQNGEIDSIVSEHFRKGFIAADRSGHIGIYHSTAEQTLLVEKASDDRLAHLAISPRANAAVVETAEGLIQFWKIENEHPETSWHSLWGKVWYESYDQPEYLWQSSSSDNDFEPKFSLTPISFGTIKAAFYAMLLAIPLAILGAIYTAYFMAPDFRKVVKPTIEIMEALPTVILGFLAGLWLAPALEENLAGVFCLIVLMPLGIVFFSWFWCRLPRSIQYRLPEGWQPLLMVPVVFFLGWFAFELSHPFENLFFDGDLRGWLTNDLGIPFDQRNSIVVGVAMGFAVIPTIFSITEDAVFSVPKHLTFGSLALGATPWQTMIKVVLLTASPGIFSAVMIGFGRAVGETMIVLMATGNTPIMDFSIFQGMRTLAANIAVEMPESEVASTHYRVLFLAALVLFIFTFIFNTLAEIIRQRLRKKYSSL